MRLSFRLSSSVCLVYIGLWDSIRIPDFLLCLFLLTLRDGHDVCLFSQKLLDYEVDSDDEWEEEEPGESLSHSEGVSADLARWWLPLEDRISALLDPLTELLCHLQSCLKTSAKGSQLAFQLLLEGLFGDTNLPGRGGL